MKKTKQNDESSKDEKRPTKKELREMQKELIGIMLERANVKVEDIYDAALHSWLRHNLDLLTDKEIKKYMRVIILL